MISEIFFKDVNFIKICMATKGIFCGIKSVFYKAQPGRVALSFIGSRTCYRAPGNAHQEGFHTRVVPSPEPRPASSHPSAMEYKPFTCIIFFMHFSLNS